MLQIVNLVAYMVFQFKSIYSSINTKIFVGFVGMVSARYSEIKRANLPSFPLSRRGVEYVIRQKINGLAIRIPEDEEPRDDPFRSLSDVRTSPFYNSVALVNLSNIVFNVVGKNQTTCPRSKLCALYRQASSKLVSKGLFRNQHVSSYYFKSTESHLWCLRQENWDSE